MGDELVVRRATPADADALAEIVVDGFASYLEFAPAGWKAPDRLELALGFAVQLQTADRWCWIAEAGGAGVGQVAIMPVSLSRVPVDEPDLAHLSHLFVRRSAQGTGVAKRLLTLAHDEARAAGFTAIRLFTPADHARARRFYEREGWKPRGERFFEPPIGLDLIEYRVHLAPKGV